MRTKIIMLFSLCLLLAGRANAQWVVTDPTNLAGDSQYDQTDYPDLFHCPKHDKQL